MHACLSSSSPPGQSMKPSHSTWSSMQRYRPIRSLVGHANLSMPSSDSGHSATTNTVGPLYSLSLAVTGISSADCASWRAFSLLICSQIEMAFFYVLSVRYELFLFSFGQSETLFTGSIRYIFFNKISHLCVSF